MNVQRHTRMAEIKKHSLWIKRILNLAIYVLLPMAVITYGGSLVFGRGETMAFLPSFELLVLGNGDFMKVSFDASAKLIWFAYGAVLVFCSFMGLRHLRNYMALLSEAEVFNRAALRNITKALQYLLALFAAVTIFRVGVIMSVQVSGIDSPIRHASYSVDGGNLILLTLAVVQVLIYALEMACDINEESELTI